MPQAPPPGAYPIPPNGAGPRPSMPPTPIPSHAHPYYQQSPQRTCHAQFTVALVLIHFSSATRCSLPDDDASPGTPALIRPLSSSACTNGWCWSCLSPLLATCRCVCSYCLPRCSLLSTMWRSLRCSVTRARCMVSCVLSLRPSVVFRLSCHHVVRCNLL